MNTYKNNIMVPTIMLNIKPADPKRKIASKTQGKANSPITIMVTVLGIKFQMISKGSDKNHIGKKTAFKNQAYGHVKYVKGQKFHIILTS